MALNWLAVIWKTLAERPKDSAIMVAFLIVAALMELAGLAAIVPILRLLLGEPTGKIEQVLSEVLGAFGLDPSLEVLIVILILLAIVKALVLFTARQQVGNSVTAIAYDLRKKLIAAISGARWSYYVSKPGGELANSLTFEVENASNSYFHSARFLADAVVTVAYIVSVALFSPVAAVLAGLITPVLLYLVRGFISLAQVAGQEQSHLLKVSCRTLIDRLSGFKSLKATANEAVLDSALQDVNFDLAKAKRKEIFAKEGLVAAQEALVLIFLAITLYLLVGVLGTQTSDILLLCLVFMRIMSRVGALQTSVQGVVRCQAFRDSLGNAIAAAFRESEEARRGKKAKEHKSNIELCDVTFSYGGNKVLDRVSLELPFGSFTAIVGSSGSGKSTLIDIITGLQKPSGGAVYIDGELLSSLAISTWRQQIGYVPQEPILIHDTVRNNLTLFKEGVTDKELWEALAAVGLKEHVKNMEQGIETSVGERGQVLSGGQRQRLIIARALCLRPRVLILDEATSGLDLDTEKDILGIIAQLGMTRIAISHQPALKSYVSQIVEL